MNKLGRAARVLQAAALTLAAFWTLTAGRDFFKCFAPHRVNTLFIGTRSARPLCFEAAPREPAKCLAWASPGSAPIATGLA